MKTRLLLVVGSFLLIGMAWAGLEYKFRYKFPGFASALSPSLVLELKQSLGLSKFYSQFGQDKWVIGVVFPGVKDGFFLDIGAADGELFSNSKALEDLGWKGIAVDPFPTNWEGRTCLLFKEVLSSKKGEKVEFREAGERGGIEKDLGHWKNDPIMRKARVVILETTTVADVLERGNAPAFIHFVSLDTEGSELEILKAFPFGKYRVGAFAIEHNNEEPKRTLIRKLLQSNGYRFAREQVADDFFVAQ